jgi:hypothetical protein
MANKKISELNPASALQSSDLIAVVQENQGSTEQPLETRKTTVGALKTAIVPSFQSGDGSVTVSTQGNTVDFRVANSPIMGGYAEDFPLSMAEGGQSVSVGFYGVRFSPGQNFIAKYAQICKRDNMTSGSFVVALYSAGTTANGGRTENMQLLAQSNVTTMAGNGVGNAEFSENQQILLEADKEYYIVLYVQHPSNSSRGLICKRRNANDWGNSNLTLAFSGTSQTVLTTLGSSNFSTIYPSTNVNSIVLPYMKIFGDTVIQNNAGQIPSSQVLVINDNNVSDYLSPFGNALTDVYLILPEGYSTIVVDTTTSYQIWKIQPETGIEFANYKKVMIMGNAKFCEGTLGEGPSANAGDYRISRYWYTQHYNSIIDESFAEFILRNKVWYTVFY